MFESDGLFLLAISTITAFVVISMIALFLRRTEGGGLTTKMSTTLTLVGMTLSALSVTIVAIIITSNEARQAAQPSDVTVALSSPPSGPLRDDIVTVQGTVENLRPGILLWVAVQDVESNEYRIEGQPCAVSGNTEGPRQFSCGELSLASAPEGVPINVYVVAADPTAASTILSRQASAAGAGEPVILLNLPEGASIRGGVTVIPI